VIGLPTVSLLPGDTSDGGVTFSVDPSGAELLPVEVGAGASGVPTEQPMVVASAAAPTNAATVLNLLFIKISKLNGGAGGESTVPGDILH
jgi:hypothetical protein